VVASEHERLTSHVPPPKRANPYEPAPFRRRAGGVGTDQLQKVCPRAQRYSRYCRSSRELPVGDAGAWQMVQRRPLVLMCAPYSRRSEARRAIQVALRAEASAGRSE
jgi:hypothetical protein